MSTIVMDLEQLEAISDLMKSIENNLSAYNINNKLRIQTLLQAEEVLVLLKEHATDTKTKVTIKKSLGVPTIEIRMPGNEFDGNKLVGSDNFLPSESDESSETEDAIRALILRNYGDRLKYKNHNGVNIVSITVGDASKKNIYYTLGALVLALILGLLFNIIVPRSVNVALCNYVFTPVKDMFMSAIKMVVGPVVFFSIATCISQFTNLKDLGRLGIKVFVMYTFTTILAIVIGYAAFCVLKPGSFGSIVATQTVEAAEEVDVSFVSTIVNIIPSNFFQPFLSSDTLQIIFLAIISGMAVGLIGDYSSMLKKIFEACNELFLAIIAIVVRFLPYAVFSSIFLIIINAGTDALFDVLKMGATYIAADIFLILVYGFMVLTLARLNPFTFFKKNWQGMITSFTLSSSNAAMPTNMNLCDKEMGISERVYSFSIPLGATVNMDGTSLYLVIVGLFLARVYGVNVPISTLLTTAFTIIMLSVSTPGVPGANVVALSILLNQLNVPLEGIGLVLGIDAILDMFRTMSNTTGDVSVSLIVAKSENLVDMSKWKRTK